MKDHRRITFATAVFVTHFAFLLSMQFQSSAGLRDTGVMAIVGHQYQAILASAVVSLLYMLVSGAKFGKACFYTCYTVLLTVYATNLVYFKLSGQYFSMSSVDDFGVADVGNYWGSFVAEIGSTDCANYALAITIGMTLMYLDIRAKAREGRPKRKPLGSFVTGVAAATLFGFSFVSVADSKVETVTQYPLMPFLGSIGGSAHTERPSLLRKMTPQQYYQLQNGTALADQNEQAILSKNLEILRSRKRNIVMVVVESVGSKQLFEDGLPRKDVAPFLHSQAGNSIMFDNLATIYPASTYSNVAIATGGLTLTWGSIGSALPHPYIGQTVESAFKEGGWRTGLFAAVGLNFGSLNMFYGGLGYDTFFDPDTLSDELREKYAAHSWGVDERFVADKALTWAKAGSEPFFLTFLTVMAHHPYGAPDDYESPFKGDDNIDKYKTSIHFTDSVIGKIAADLKANGLEDTLLFIVGDHGEAFGDIHEGNLLHKGNLYEENIGDYLMVIDLSGEIEPISSSRRGTTGDVMPTMLDAQGLVASGEVVGQSLLSDAYSERIAYFQKSEEPQKWGLRDGKWKFIAEISDPQKAELYDLEADPEEKNNLIAQHPDWIAGYVDRLSNWYVRTNDDFVAQLQGYEYEGQMGLALADIAKPGPKRIAVGRKRGSQPFEELKPDINPDEDFVVWTSGAAFLKNTEIRYEFTSPTGKKSTTLFTHEKDWVDAWVRAPSDAPREEGKWKVELFDGDAKLIETTYNLSRKAPLHWSVVDKSPGIREIDVGIKPKGDDFHILAQVNPRENVSLLVQSVPFGVDRKLDFLWIAPDDSFETDSFTQKADWDNCWVFRDPTGPMTPGTWRVEVWMDGEFQIGQNFEVSADAPLFNPIEDQVASLD